MSPAAEQVIQRLDATRQKWWIFTLLSTAVLAISASFATLLLLMLTDALVKFSQGVLAGMLAFWALVTITLVVMVGRRLRRAQRSLEATARCIETEYPDLGSNLINVVQLADDTKNEDRAFCQAAVVEAAQHAGGVRFEDAATKESRWRRFRYCMQTPRDLAESLAVLGLLILIAVVANWLDPNLSSAASRLMSPWEFVPSVGSLKIVRVTPEDTDVLLGESLAITAEIIDRAKGEPYRATLFFAGQGQKEQNVPMSPGERFAVDGSPGAAAGTAYHRRYTIALPSVLGPLDYRLEIGDSQTRRYHVSVSEKPTVEEVEATLHYPPYLGRADETLVERTADLEAPQYTVAKLRIRPSTAITKGYLDAEGRIFTGRVEDQGELLVVEMPLVKNTTFTVHLFKGEQSDPDPRINRVHVLPDRPPSVELLKPPRQSRAAPGSDVAVMIRASDDHGLGQVQLEMKIKPPASTTPGDERPDAAAPEDLPVKTVQQWTKFQSSTTAVLHHRLELAEKVARPGQTVMVRATVRDRRNFGGWELDLRPQQAASGWHAIEVIDEEAEVNATLEQLDSLRGALFKMLEKQIRAQARAALVPRAKQIEQATAEAGQVRTLQVEIQKSSIGLVKSIGQSEREDYQAIKRILNQLAFGEMLKAVQQCDGLVKIELLEGFPQPVGELIETQQRVIGVLRKMLDITRRAQTEELAEMKHRRTSDLPDDARQKLDALKAALDKALEEQRKVIEASENLAKAPVEDFAEEKEQLLKTLEAAEDDWSKFINELNTDLSKLPEQDFANPSMLKELVEIQTEIKMADDAMLKKTADIAVPLEQLGAEMAEEIQTNMEKWLPDTPDRERWSQEESLTDEGKEAPMAELPGELEDLIGDLMEDEEDLFDEMEDVSSSAADSLDKGAGWDVADGPISNMSAKGATGNRLPNTSEIGGRAGEGRQGKSSGEFVGDEAVGKGGRKTPSRLTPDPYVAGQIKDHSRDPTGGATGGGKESGEGGEGLEGPAPGPRGQRQMNRLAGKQAALRNKAEGVDLEHFKVMGFHHTDLQRMIELMGQVERDLKAGRYQNALRRRNVMVEGLGNVKQHLEGEFEVHRDSTVNLPTDVQEELLGSMGDPSPAGWEEMNRQYFERLSRGGVEVPGSALSPSGGSETGPVLTGTSPTLTGTDQ